MNRPSGPHLNIKTVFPGMGIPMLKIRRSRDRIIFNMAIPILVRQHLYIDMAPRSFYLLMAWVGCAGPWFSMKMFYKYRKSHGRDKLILQPSCLHNGIFDTSEAAHSSPIRVRCSVFMWVQSMIYVLSKDCIQYHVDGLVQERYTVKSLI